MPLDPERWSRVERLFAGAADLEPAERSSFLDRECADPEIRREVERLLGHDTGSTERVARPIREAVIARGEPRGDARPRRQRIGPYRVLRELGRGGMGAVYLAARDDAEYRKEVAIKLVPGGVDSDDLLRRFRAERQFLASLEHPCIARLLDGGATEEGLPYLVMDYVDGEPIDDYCDRNRLDVDARLRLFRSVCSAVQHAHRNLIVHRDIKPANILVTAGGEPKLLDFGIAKLLDAEGGEGAAAPATATRLMTPEYASPEQIRGESITTATDVYSLGLLLYELLTGRRPYALEGRSFDAVARAITGQEPQRPSTAVGRAPRDTDPGGTDATPERISHARSSLPDGLRRRLAGDLDDIILMALRKEPERRYASVERLSEDVRRHLEGLPVSARADTWGYRAAKFVRRNRWGVAAATAVLLLVSGSSVAFYLQGRRIAAERDRARTEAATAAQVTEFLVELFEYSDPAEARGREIPVREILDRGARRVRAELAGETEVQARLMEAMGKVYGSLGRWDDALSLSEAALERQRARHGEDSPEVARALNLVGGMRSALGDQETAERELTAALDMRRELLGPAHDDIVDSLNTLSVLRTSQARYDEAEDLAREALAMARELHGERHALTGKAANNLGQVLKQRGEYEKAERIHRDNLAMRREVLGEDHPSVGTSLSNLGQVLGHLGRFDEAERMLRDAGELNRKLNGEESVAYALSLNNLGTILKEKGEVDRAEPIARQSLDIIRRLLGPEHSLTLVGINNLANLLHDRGDMEGAEALHRQSLELHRRVRGRRHPTTAGVLNNLANLLWDKGDYDEAEPLYRETIELDLEALGPEHPFVAMDYANLAALLRDRGQPEDREEAERLFRDSVNLARAALGDAHVNVASNAAQYAIFLIRLGRLDEAEERIRQAQRILEDAGAPDHFHHDQTRSILGEYLTARRRFAEAEPLVVQGYEALCDKLGPRSGPARRALDRVVALYEAWGRPDQAASYRARKPF